MSCICLHLEIVLLFGGFGLFIYINFTFLKSSMADSSSTRVLFICLGNICRSPMAACVFRHLAAKRGVSEKWVIDSAALGGWHVGGKGDSRMRVILEKNGVDNKHKVRQITQDDFRNFDLIIGMDHENISELTSLAPSDSIAKIELFGQYDPEKELIIRDPYYDRDIKGFEKVYEQCVRCSNGLLDTK